MYIIIIFEIPMMWLYEGIILLKIIHLDEYILKIIEYINEHYNEPEDYYIFDIIVLIDDLLVYLSE